MVPWRHTQNNSWLLIPYRLANNDLHNLIWSTYYIWWSENTLDLHITLKLSRNCVVWKLYSGSKILTYLYRCTEFLGSLLTSWIIAYEKWSWRKTVSIKNHQKRGNIRTWKPMSLFVETWWKGLASLSPAKPNPDLYLTKCCDFSRKFPFQVPGNQKNWQNRRKPETILLFCWWHLWSATPIHLAASTDRILC